MEREREANTMTTELYALKAKLKEKEDEITSLRREYQQREKERQQLADAMRRQDSAKAREWIERLEAELSRTEAQSREKTKAYEDLRERLQNESASQNRASRVLEFMKNLAPVFRSRRDAKPLYGDEGVVVLSPRRVATGDSIQSVRRAGGDGGSRHNQ
jgi:septal ring factor EnvC (AmiA/AmiB activator)